MKLFKKISNYLFPVRCLGCQKEGLLFCEECFKKISYSSSYNLFDRNFKVLRAERAGSYLEENFCAFCTRISKFGSTCSHCKKSYYLNGALIALYYDNLIRKLIKSAKYKPYFYSLLEKLTLILVKKIKNSPLYKNYFLKENFILLPIPLTLRKKAERGFNQAEIIASTLSLQLNLPLDLKILKKIKNTKSQSLLSLKERRENIKNSFKVDPSKVKGRSFILVDDLITSGSTINEAAKILKKAGAYKIWAFALARNLKNRASPTPIKIREIN